MASWHRSFSQWFRKSSKKQARVRQSVVRVGLEILEDRLNPAPLAPWGTPREGGSELVLISRELLGRVPDEELAGATVFTLDAGGDLVSQMTGAIASGEEWQTVRIITHGSSGALWVGDQVLDAGVLETHRSQLKLWGFHLASQADILLYGCSIASTPEGKIFVDNMACAINANVAASVNTSGNSGDLFLEYKKGFVKAEIVSPLKLWEKKD